MAMSVRIPPDRERLIERYAKETGKTKSAVIIEAIDEKFGLAKSRAQIAQDMAGWMVAEEAGELRSSLKAFEAIHEDDWP